MTTRATTIVIFMDDGNAESVSAAWVGNGKYRIKSIPVFTCTVHYGDIVDCDDSNPEVAPRFLSVTQPSDDITVQLVFTKRGAQVHDVLRTLEDVGVHIEQVSGALWVASLPRRDYARIEQLLDDFPNATLRWWQPRES